MSIIDPTSIQGTLSGQEVQPQAEGDIATQFQQLQQLIQSQEAPQDLPSQPAPTPLQAFGSALASNLGATLLQNPALALQAQRQLNERFQQAEAVGRANVEQRNLFDRSRFLQTLEARGAQLDSLIDQAEQEGRSEAALKLLEEKDKINKRSAKLKADADKEKADADRASRESIARENRESREGIAAGGVTSREKIAADKLEEGEEAPEEETPLNIAQLTSNERAIAQKFGVEKEGFTFLGFGKKKVSKDAFEALSLLYQNGIAGGAPTVRETSFRKLSVLFGNQFNGDPEEMAGAFLDAGVTDNETIKEGIRIGQNANNR